MKKFSKILMSGLAALCLWACSDEANVSQPANAENDVYVEFGVQLMQGSSSRSTTTDGEDGNGSNSTGGAEVGKNYENSVKEILLVLTKADGSLIVSQRLDVEPKEDGKYPRLVTTWTEVHWRHTKQERFTLMLSVIPFLLSISMI